MTPFPQLKAFAGGKNLIRVIGHRGARGVLPENSIEGFAFTLSIGVNLLEFDVVLTKDRVPVITHNHRLTGSNVRQADGRFLWDKEPKVSSLTLSEIGNFDIGTLDGASAYGQRFPDQALMDGVQIPTLNDLLELVCRPEHQSAHLMLEMKSDPDEPDPETARKKLVSSVIQQVRSTDLSNRTLLHSFDWHLLKEAQLIAPDLPTSYLTQLPTNSEAIGEDSSKEIGPNLLGREAETPDLVAEAGGSLWCPFYCDLSAKGLKRARELGLLVAVWTVNDYDDIDAMIDLGVDAIISDYPGRVQRKLRDKGYQWNLPVA